MEEMVKGKWPRNKKVPLLQKRQTVQYFHDKVLSKVLARLREAHIPLSVDDIYQGLRKSVKGNSDIRKKIVTLQERGLIVEIKGPKGGKKYVAKPTL